MKKTILIIAVIVLSLSCSKDKGEELDIITFNDSRMGGTWYLSKVIKPDGSFEDYIHSCTSNKDRVELSTSNFREYYHTTDCQEFDFDSCEPIILNFNNVTACNTKYDGIYILNGNTLTVDYGEERSFTQLINNLTSAKGLVLTRN